MFGEGPLVASDRECVFKLIALLLVGTTGTKLTVFHFFVIRNLETGVDSFAPMFCLAIIS